MGQGGVGWGTFVSVDNIKRSTYAHGGGVLYGLESFNNKRVCGHSSINFIMAGFGS